MQNLPVIDGNTLLKRWDIDDYGLLNAILYCNLPVYTKPRIIFDVQLSSYANNLRRETEVNSENINNFRSSLEHPYDEKQRIDAKAKLFFKLEDVKKFENEHKTTLASTKSDRNDENNLGDSNQISGEEKRELGRLKLEKENWDDSIEAAVHMGIYCKEFYEEKGTEITSKDFNEEIYRINKHLPDTTIKKIWGAIPAKYRKKAGRPPK